MAELWAGGAILFLQKAFHRDLTQLNPAFQNLKISLLELEQRNKAFYTSKYHFCNWGKSKIKIQINDELQNHTNRKQCKSLHEITYQRSLLASAQRLGGHGLQGLSFSPLSPLSTDIRWYLVGPTWPGNSGMIAASLCGPCSKPKMNGMGPASEGHCSQSCSRPLFELQDQRRMGRVQFCSMTCSRVVGYVQKVNEPLCWKIYPRQTQSYLS